jgi:hypothetical protein
MDGQLLKFISKQSDKISWGCFLLLCLAYIYYSLPIQVMGIKPGTFAEIYLDGVDTVWVSRQKEVIAKLTRASDAKDQIKVARILASGDIMFVDSGVRALVISTDSELKQIKLMDGKYAGQKGWIPYDCLR